MTLFMPIPHVTLHLMVVFDYDLLYLLTRLYLQLDLLDIARHLSLIHLLARLSEIIGISVSVSEPRHYVF